MTWDWRIAAHQEVVETSSTDARLIIPGEKSWQAGALDLALGRRDVVGHAMHADALRLAINEPHACPRIAVTGLPHAAGIKEIASRLRSVREGYLGEFLRRREVANDPSLGAIIFKEARDVRMARQAHERAARREDIDGLGHIDKVLKPLRMRQGGMDQREGFHHCRQRQPAQRIKLGKTELIARPDQGGPRRVIEPSQIKFADSRQVMVAPDHHGVTRLQAG